MLTRLTDKGIKALKPGKRREIWDSTVAGFGVRVGSSGRPMFVYRYRAAGKRRRVAIGPYPALSLSAARAQALRPEREAAC